MVSMVCGSRTDMAPILRDPVRVTPPCRSASDERVHGTEGPGAQLVRPSSGGCPVPRAAAAAHQPPGSCPGRETQANGNIFARIFEIAAVAAAAAGATGCRAGVGAAVALAEAKWLTHSPWFL